jgi:hypothetical protein
VLVVVLVLENQDCGTWALFAAENADFSRTKDDDEHEDEPNSQS